MIYLLTLVSAILVATPILAHFIRKGPSSKSEPPTSSLPEWSRLEAEKTVHDAERKAEAIITEAELEGIKLAAETKIGAQNFGEEYDKKLEHVLDETKKAFIEHLTQTESDYKKFITDLEQKSQASEAELQNQIKTRINELLLNLEQNMSGFLASAEQESTEAINLELKSARQLIDTYKQQQLTLIDENIVAVLERTLGLILRNKLTINDQMDLIFEALEKAKLEKFFV